jgi:glycosyltransferase involved in cell wall biosynthesis
MTKTPVRVVYLTHTLGVGGAEELILNMVTRLPRDRYEPIVCCFENPPGPIGPEIAGHGIRVIPLGVVPGWRRPRAWWSIVRQLRQLRPQIVHTFMLPASLYGRSAAVAAGVPIIIGTEVNIYERKQRHHILIERLLTARSACVVASAESVKSAYVRQLGIDADAVRVVYNAVNWERLDATKSPGAVREELGIPSDRLVVGVVATLQDKKGHRVLLDAVARTPGLDAIWLMLVGDGPMRSSLEQYAATLEIADRVTFCGTRRDLGNVLPAMDVFALPSLWEGLPLALILAMGASRPVVATRLAGIPEVVTDDDTGLLVEPGDAAALGAALARVCNDGALRIRMGARARAAVRDRFGADAYSAAVIEIYEEFLAKETARGEPVEPRAHPSTLRPAQGRPEQRRGTTSSG